MKHANKHMALLKFLNCLPRKIIECHGQEYVPHLVLHDFCHELCFNLSKVAYLIDNPDFNCIKGVAGICKHEKGYCADVKDVWREQQKYCSYLQESEFNNKVCSFACESLKNKKSEQEAINEIAQQLGFSDPRYLIWPMKHDNHGILLFQAEDGDAELIEEHLEHGVYYLGLCPVH
jgi:AraC-like DNA-binding protein